MATTRLMPLHTGKGRTVGQGIRNIIDYTENPQKTDGGRLITSWQCDSRIADAEFLFTKNQYIQKTGRVRGEDDVIAGEKEHTPRKSAAAPVKPEKRSGNLLVDIQAKLRAGKGAGYARWATLFNLKQMAQTVAYLQDHELLDYAVLSEKAAAASAHFNELSARIKAAEKRMAEIAVLREHIVGYAKTRDTYVAYRKAGYSKKFLAEHESEITIHKAAKNYFDGLGFKKLPTIKALNTEYAELLAEKKAAYADYRKAREEMKELLTAKANIDRILELDKEQEEANERREKEAGQSPNKHETGGFRVNGIRLFSQSGYRFALLAAFLSPLSGRCVCLLCAQVFLNR